MKLLVIDLDHPFGPAPGGQYTMTRRYIFPLARLHQVKILTAGLSSGVKRTVEGVRYEGIGWGRGRLRQLTFIHQARQRVKTDRSYDCLIEKFTSPIGPIGTPRLTDRPVIGFVDFIFWREMSEKYHLPIWPLAQHLLGSYRFLFTYNRLVAHQLATLAPQAEVLTAPVVTTRPHRRKGWGAHLLFIARPDWHQKGFDYLRAIVDQLDPRVGKLVVAGFTADHPDWQRWFGDYHGPIPIEVRGYLRDQALEDCYSDSRLVLVTSRYEVSPLVMAEAASYGLPLVCFSLAHFADFTHCLKITPFDTTAFARAVSHLATDQSATERWSERAYQWAVEEFNRYQPTLLDSVIQRATIPVSVHSTS